MGTSVYKSNEVVGVKVVDGIVGITFAVEPRPSRQGDGAAGKSFAYLDLTVEAYLRIVALVEREKNAQS